jgi:2-oxoglutarate dehydrogenase E2 component (dihydrolipoamide succinyltransferase)
MRVNVNMPQLGESVAEGTILKWLKQVGDTVEKDEDILEISTDKVDSEIPSPAAGVLVEILAQEGETIEVGKPIAVIETDASQAKVVEKPAEPAKEEAAKEKAPAAPAVAYGTGPGEEAVTVKRKPDKEKAVVATEKRFYSPLVRKIAEEESISQAELDSIAGSGASGRVTKKDLEAYLEKRGKAPVPAKAVPAVKAPVVQPEAPAASPTVGEGEEIVPMDVMRQKIAEHMVKSAFTAPHVTSVSEADMSNIVKFRERHKAEFQRREGFKLTYTPIIIEATIKALKEYPWLNASLDGENIIVKHYVNMGMAVALENGLIVPVIGGADGMNLLALARAVNDLSERARTKRLSPDEVHGSTFSITNPGVFGNLFGSPIINQPNLAILGIGAIVKRPVVVGDDAITVRPMMYLSLSYDHRIIDGALAGQFLERLVYHMENYDLDATI